MKYEILFSVEGWGRTYIEATSRAEAIEMFDDGDWTPAKEDVGYSYETVTPVED